MPETVIANQKPAVITIDHENKKKSGTNRACRDCTACCLEELESKS
jgi:hypothetical protein